MPASLIVTGLGLTGFTAAAVTFGVRLVTTAVLSKVMANRAAKKMNGAGAAENSGARVQLPPATDNKLAVVYGSAFVSPTIVDAKISTDQKTMWYVCALSEVTDTGTITFGDIYWGDKKLTFDTTDTTKVVSWTDSNGAVDTKVNGKMFIYLYRDGVNNPVNTSSNAVTILSDSQIAESQRYNGTKYNYTEDGVTYTPQLDKTCFAIVKILYDQETGMTGLQELTFQLQNSLTKPGSVIYDYLKNDRYGCGIPESNIDVDSLTELNNYSDQLISYTPVGGGLSSTYRYRINGPINTGNNCLNNYQQLADACDCWISWNEVESKWGVIINRSYTDYTTFANLFHITSSNIIGGVDIIPTDLNSTFNSVEVQFPNAKIKDQTDYQYVNLDAEDRNPNEPDNQLILQLPQVNSSVQAKYIAVRRLIQSREDLLVNLSMDYSGIQINAGDVVKVTHEAYGWAEKLFRVLQVQEVKNIDGSLTASLSLSEYNNQVYENIDISDYDPEENTGLTDPTLIGRPDKPIVSKGTVIGDGTNQLTTVSTFVVNAVVPTTGSVLGMDFFYGTGTDVTEYKLYKTVSPNNGNFFNGGDNLAVPVADLPSNTYRWSVTAVGASTRSQPSLPSDGYGWDGPAVSNYDPTTGKGGVQYGTMAPAASGFLIRAKYSLSSTQANGTFSPATSTIINLPITVPGVSVASNEVHTWYSGTWPYTWYSTPSGLGTYQPREAAFVPSSPSQWVSLGWYPVIYVGLDSYAMTAQEWAVQTGEFHVYTDTPNTTFQLVPAPVFAVNPSSYTAQFSWLESHTISNDAVSPYKVTYAGPFAGSSTLTQIGWLIRNLTPGSTLYVSAASIGVKQNK